jgi:hypothetical protein
MTWGKLLQERSYTYHRLCGTVGMDINSEHFTQPGLHMNASGKDKIARKISDVVGKNVTRNKVKPFILKWEENHGESSNGDSDVKE